MREPGNAGPAAGAAAGQAPALAIEGIEVVYQPSVQVLRGLSLTVTRGQIVALLGSNGAGKTTTLKAVSGLLPLEIGQVRSGTIRYLGEPINGVAPHLLARRGIAHVREGRHVFEDLTVEENLVAAANALKGRGLQPDTSMIYDYFPRLKDRYAQLAGYLSGGEQQMLAIGCSTSPRSGWRRWWSTTSSRSSSASTGNRACPCCWWSRTPWRRWASPITATSWKAAGW
jgi:branched-chain amino acid transport system ATP-binding protein